MSYRVNATFEDAFACATFGNRMTVAEHPSDEWIANACQDRLISEKGYPEDTIVIINGNDPMAMVLVTEPDGSWELV